MERKGVSLMRSIGYYILRKVPRPHWCAVRSDRILSIGAGFGCTLPDLRRCLRPNLGTQSPLVREALSLLGTGQLCPDGRFPAIEDAKRIYRFYQEDPDVVLVGVCAEDAYVYSLYDSGFFPEGSLSLPEQGGYPIGGELLRENTGYGVRMLDSYLEERLDVALSRHMRITFDPESGLMQHDPGQLRMFSDALAGMAHTGWIPCMLSRYDGFVTYWTV